MIPQSRPGIRRIYFKPCGELSPRLMLLAICGGSVAMCRESLTEIRFAGTPMYNREGTILNGSRAEKSTLEIRTDAVIPEGERIAFVVECVNGDVWLIGTKEPNYPVVEYSDTSGSPSGSPSVRTYKITHSDIKSGIPVVL